MGRIGGRLWLKIAETKGKGLTINVRSKRDMKQMKKNLKKAGVAKAKVKIGK